MARESVFTLVQREHSWCSPWGISGELKKQLAVQHGLMRREGKSEIPFLIHRLRFSSLSFHTCVCPVSSESTPVPSHAADRGAEAQELVQELSVPSLQVPKTLTLAMWTWSAERQQNATLLRLS